MRNKIFILIILAILVVIVGVFVLRDLAPDNALPSPDVLVIEGDPDEARSASAAGRANSATPLAEDLSAQEQAPAAPQEQQLLPTPTPTPTAEPAPTPTPTPAPTPAPTPSSSPTPTPSQPPHSTSAKPLSGMTIGVDPGHQGKSNNELEPVSPGSSEMKKKVSSGTQGKYTRTAEHAVNLNVGLLLRDMLKEAGATVIMTRESADVNISNAERAQLFNEKKVDLGVRLHCNGSTDTSVTGAFMLIPKANPYLSDCKTAAKLILEEYGKATGIGIKKGITVRSDQTGFNWCERAIVNIEMGHMTNEAEDNKLSDGAFQKKMAIGIYNGIVSYWTQKHS